jgi:hypothetical protein
MGLTKKSRVLLLVPNRNTRGISFVCLFANSFCEFMMPAASTYDAGHHNFESPPGWAGVVSTGSSMCSFWARLELGLTQPLREVSVGWAAQSGALDAVSESAASEGYMGGWIAADDEEPARWQALEEAGAEAARSRGRRLVGRMETPRQRGLV